MEPIENPEGFRYTVEPINPAYAGLWKLYEKAKESQWTENELAIEIQSDYGKFANLSPDVQKYLKNTVAFFAVSDGAVVETAGVLASRIPAREFKIWYNHQSMMEDIHGIIYSQLVNAYIPAEERGIVFEAIKTFPFINAKMAWIKKWVGEERLPLESREIVIIKKLLKNPEHKDLLQKINESEKPIAQIILANVITEGLFFSGSFCSIFWFNHYYKGYLPGLAKSNEWISRDETMHTDVSVLIYQSYIKNKLPIESVHEMFREAVEIESAFVCDSLPNGLKGINAVSATQYIKFVADLLLVDLKLPKLYGVSNPFSWMLKQSISTRIPDFFADRAVSEYGTSVDDGFDFDEDF